MFDGGELHFHGGDEGGAAWDVGWSENRFSFELLLGTVEGRGS